MAKFTYKVVLRHSAPWSGCEGEEIHALYEFGYSDSGWDSLSKEEKADLLDEWARDEFWNAGYEYSGEVTD